MSEPQAARKPADGQHAAAWPIYKRLLGYATRYWPLLAAASVGMVVEALAGGAFVQLMKPLVNDGFVVDLAIRAT